MNREQAVQWCKNYLPQWPDNEVVNIDKIPRPLGWTWMKRVGDSKIDIVLSCGNYLSITETEVFKSKTTKSPTNEDIQLIFEYLKISRHLFQLFAASKDYSDADIERAINTLIHEDD